MFTVPVLDIKSDPLDVLLAVVGYRLSMLADSDNEAFTKLLADRQVVIEIASEEAGFARHFSFDNGYSNKKVALPKKRISLLHSKTL